ncbi:MAG: hypothetical protein BWK75_02750 [Candidatus Altiarchaeales archaeon A3]|nr:MAG: hypothetical protein BWK75_02750 [Candidatus Altiarchaeales archaeon A3]
MSKFENLVVINKGKTCGYALKLMDKNKISRLLVVDDDKLTGIITYSDIVNTLNNPRKRKFLNNARIRVSSAMTKDIIAANSSSTIKEMANIMLKNKISSVITEDAKNDRINLITKTDIIKQALNSDVPVSLISTKDAISVPSKTTIVHVRKIMEENGIHRLLVVDGDSLAGIITEKNIADALKLFRDLTADYNHPDIKLLKVTDFMKKDLKTLEENAKVKDAIKIMLEHNISGIPIIKEDGKFGIVTKTDIVRGIADGLIFTL